MPISTETLLTHPRCFGLTTASPLQRAVARAADGAPLGDLANDPDVIAAFGGEEAIAKLPHEPPKEFFLIAAIRCGKSLFSAVLALRIALTVDMSFMKPTEIGRVSVLSLDKDKAGIVLEHLMGALTMEGGALGRYLMKSPRPNGESIYIRRDDGRRVRIVVAAGKRAGASLVSRWTLAAVLDEGCRMSGAEDGVVSFDESRKAVILRLSRVRGGQFIVVSSPHAARGPVYDRVRAYNANPTSRLVIVQATGPMLNPYIWTPEECEKARLTDEQAYVTDILGEFADVEAGWLLADDVDRALGQTQDNGRYLASTGRQEAELQREPGYYYSAALDPGMRSNSWTLVIVGYRPSEDGQSAGDRYSIVRVRQWTGSKREPLNARNTLMDVRAEVIPYGITEVWTDQWGADFVIQIAADIRLTVNEDKSTTSEKDERHVDFRSKLIARQISPTTEPVWRSDMLAARIKRVPGGQKLELPLTRDGRHCDYVPATLLAMAKASVGPSHWDRLTEARNRGYIV
jgi:hypothetical protein